MTTRRDLLKMAGAALVAPVVAKALPVTRSSIAFVDDFFISVKIESGRTEWRIDRHDDEKNKWEKHASGMARNLKCQTEVLRGCLSCGGRNAEFDRAADMFEALA